MGLAFNSRLKSHLQPFATSITLNTPPKLSDNYHYSQSYIGAASISKNYPKLINYNPLYSNKAPHQRGSALKNYTPMHTKYYV